MRPAQRASGTVPASASAAPKEESGKASSTGQTEAAKPSRRSESRPRSLVAPLALLLALAACLGVAAVYFGPARPGVADPERLSALERDLAAFEQRLDAAERKLGETAGTLAEVAARQVSRPQETAGGDARIAVRVAEVAARAEAGEAALRKQAETLAARLAALEGNLESTRTAGDAWTGEIAALKRRLDRLATHPALGLDTTLPEVRPESVVALAVGQLDILVRSGRPYAQAIDRLRALSAGDPEIVAALERLAPGAVAGVSDRASLRLRFQGLLDELSAGPESAPGDGDGDGILDGVMARIRGLLRIRRTDAASEAPVTRAERALARGDLAAAAAALEGFGPEVEGWRRDARLRVAAEAALAALHGRVITLLDAALEPRSAPATGTAPTGRTEPTTGTGPTTGTEPAAGTAPASR